MERETPNYQYQFHKRKRKLFIIISLYLSSRSSFSLQVGGREELGIFGDEQRHRKDKSKKCFIAHLDSFVSAVGEKHQPRREKTATNTVLAISEILIP